MTTVGDLIDRARRDWLEPPDDQSPQSILITGVDSTTDTIGFEPSLFGPTLDTIGPGHVIEVESEAMLVLEVGDTSFRVARHHQGTAVTDHPAGATVMLPRWYRRSIFDALCDGIDNLWPELWQPASLWSSRQAERAAPADLVGVVTDHVRWVADHPGGRNGMLIFDDAFCSDYVTYKRRYERPANEDVELERNLGMNDRLLHQLVVVSAVGSLIQGRDIGATTVEHITKALEVQAVPVGTGMDLRNALLSYEEHLRTRAQDRQFAIFGTTVERHDPW